MNLKSALKILSRGVAKYKLRRALLAYRAKKALAQDAALATDEPVWRTVHPHGKGAVNANGGDIPGTPVLLESETGEVLAGMGGKFNGKHISEACSKEPTEHAQHNILRVQKRRENPQEFTKQQEAAQKRAEQQAKERQETIKKETEKAKEKVIEHQEKPKPEQPQNSAALSSLTSNSTPEEINAALDSISQIKSKKRLSSKEREREVLTKREAIKRLYKTDNKTAAKAFKERVEAVGPPQEFASFAEAREYAHKLLPQANICFDNIDVKAMTSVMSATYKVLKEFPGTGKFITVIGDSKTLGAYTKVASSISAVYDKRRQELRANAIETYSTPEKVASIKQTIADHANNALKGIYALTETNSYTIATRLCNSLELGGGYRKEVMQALDKLTPNKDGKSQLALTEEFLHDVYLSMRHRYVWRDVESTLLKEEEAGKIPPQYIPRDRGSMLRLGVVPVRNTAGVYAYCYRNECINPAAINSKDGFNSGVQLVHGSYADAEYMEKSYRHCEKIGFHPVTELSGAESVVIHELGHAIDNSISLGAMYERLSDSKEIKEIFNDAKRQHSNISGDKQYWATNPAELIAESVTAMLGGASSQAPKFMQATFEVVKKYYKDRFE